MVQRTRRIHAVIGLCLALAMPSGGAIAGSPAEADLLRALESGLRPTVLPAGAALPGWSLEARMRHHRVPGVAIAIVRNGQLEQAHGYGVREMDGNQAVDADTLFSVGSISKMVTAATVLRLVDDERLQLDRDIRGDLRRWQVPDAPGRDGPISLRMLMSHTSGLGVHGFEDYLPGEPVPTLVQVLQGTGPAKNEPVAPRFAPGQRNDYSGGGTMVVQLLLEDTVGAPFAGIAETQVFAPLGMRRSTFESPLSAGRGNIAHAHDGDGKPAALPRGWETFAEAAASGLWTSANDLGAFVAALIGSYRGEDAFLERATAVQMLTPVSRSWFGLGPRIEGIGPSRSFHHGGANDSYRAWIEGYPETGDGFVILTNGANGNALAGEIRNALSDALGLGANPPVMVLADAPPPSPDLAGRYRIDGDMPMDVRAALADVFETDDFEARVADGVLELALPGQASPMSLRAMAPGRYASAGGSLRFLFHRDPHGRVEAVSVLHPASDSRAYYRRE